MKNIKKLLVSGQYIEDEKINPNESGIQAFDDLSEKVIKKPIILRC